MKFSIIIPTYNPSHKAASQCLIPCVESIKQYTDLSEVEVIIVANGCGEDTRDYVCALGPPFKTVWLNEPAGYTHSTNVGIEAARGEYLILLNDDTILLPQAPNDWLNILHQPFIEDEKVAITGPVLHRCPSTDREFLIFFCVMLSHAVVKQIGALDEIFNPGYGEDTDWCLRAVEAGYKICCPIGEKKLIDKGCEDLPEWKRMKMWSGNFPIYHDGNKTFGSDPKYEGLIVRNSKILEERFPRVKDKTGKCACGNDLLDGVCIPCTEREGIRMERAGVIDGWFGFDEGKWLADQTRQLPAGARVLEIGSWHGRSSRFIADNLPEGGQVWCVDTWIGSSGEPEMHGTAHYDRGDHAHQWWWCNLQEHILAGRCVPVRMHSENAAHTFGHLIEKGELPKFDLIFIDGDHSEEGIKTDVEAWLPHLKEGGLLCGHDYYKENEGPHWVHVRQYVETKFPDVQKTATSIWYTRPHERPYVYDCFPINNELDLLEIRFRELDKIVDRWVITEATKTHGAQDKPLYFAESLEQEPGRWARWRERISHIVVSDFPENSADPFWSIERHQRDMIMQALVGCKDSDIIMISDVDEIPRTEAVQSYRTEMGLCALEMRLLYGYMNLEGNEPWTWTRLLPYSIMKQMTPCAVRYNWGYDKPNYDQTIPNAGWHFSFMGGPDEWIKKLEDTPHQEYNKPEFKNRETLFQRALHGDDILGREHLKYRWVEVDESFPQAVREDLSRWQQRGFILMHPESWRFIQSVKDAHPEYFHDREVLEVGSLNINGTVRQFFSNCQYTGIDLGEGDCVDMVAHVTELATHGPFDVVISSEALEHDERWMESLRAMYALLKPDGLLLITCAGPTRPEHGTTRTDTYSSPFTTDYYRNISKEDFMEILPPDKFSECTIGYERGQEDLNFWGVKRVDNVVPLKKPPKLGDHSVGTVTAEVCTKDRYHTTLPLALSAIINQTVKPDKLVIYDDSEQRIEAEQLHATSPYNGLFKMAADKGIKFVVFGTPRAGQVSNHQHCLDTAETEYIWRVDDDEIPEPDCLKELLNTFRDYGRGGQQREVGAVAGLVHHPASISPLPAGIDGSLNDLSIGVNLQWHQWNGQIREVDHLYSTFLYRVDAARAAGGYPRDLSPVGHREETIFTHSMKRAGYKILVTPYAKTWHLRESGGGIRSFSDNSLWAHDEEIFQQYLKVWNVDLQATKLVVLDLGLGDHFICKGIFNDLRRKFPDRKWTLATCFPDVFRDEDVTQISIADAKLLLGDRYDNYSVYKYAWERNLERPMAEVMMEFFSK